MKNLPNLFKLMQLTRNQVQYGYVLAGIPKEELSTLAAHHYLVTFFAWQLAINLKTAGANIDVQKVMEFALIHDIGELFGGDISAYYAKMNPKARKFAKAFEEENQRFLSKFFGPDEKRIKKMTKEILDAKSDEALIAKVADYVECAEFKIFVNRSSKEDAEFNKEKVLGFIKKMKDIVAKEALTEFVDEWMKHFGKVDYINILTGKKPDLEFVPVEE